MPSKTKMAPVGPGGAAADTEGIDGGFEPVLIPKHERRFTGFDENIIAMYARGMTMHEVEGLLLESYGSRSVPSSSAALEPWCDRVCAVARLVAHRLFVPLRGHEGGSGKAVDPATDELRPAGKRHHFSRRINAGEAAE